MNKIKTSTYCLGGCGTVTMFEMEETGNKTMHEGRQLFEVREHCTQCHIKNLVWKTRNQIDKLKQNADFESKQKQAQTRKEADGGFTFGC